ncbi:hypothetical protein L5515_009389 [Caenorhabditis briggsae]|uniref:F-box domain-containing protein n=1 Tax=Caenorhabditis briggsae TaxID=6238 RepID=A0AAE9F3F3_CAEBR|nr:hypothetical protein L5515_009389 [Caenorhabditis briggsae]
MLQERSDILKNDRRLLKACILYETLQNKPIFESYISVCKAVGHDVMEYGDFEYWYLKFCNNQNLDFEDEPKSEQKKLEQLPVEIQDMIVQRVDPIERNSVRSMNSTLKSLAEKHNSSYEKIDIFLSIDSLNISLDNKRFEFVKNQNSCLVQIDNGEKVLEKEDFLKLGMSNLIRILISSKINTLILRLYSHEEKFTSNFIKRLPNQLEVKSFNILKRGSQNMLKMLKIMKPETLKTILLDSRGTPEEHFNELFATEQFKNAKRVNIQSFGMVQSFEELSENFQHLKQFNVGFETMEVEDIIKIRDWLPLCPNFKKCCIEKKRNRVAEFAEALGAQFPEGHQGNFIHRHQIANGYLKFQLERDGVKIKRKLNI